MAKYSHFKEYATLNYNISDVTKASNYANTIVNNVNSYISAIKTITTSLQNRLKKQEFDMSVVESDFKDMLKSVKASMKESFLLYQDTDQFFREIEDFNSLDYTVDNMVPVSGAIENESEIEYFIKSQDDKSIVNLLNGYKNKDLEQFSKNLAKDLYDLKEVWNDENYKIFNNVLSDSVETVNTQFNKFCDEFLTKAIDMEKLNNQEVNKVQQVLNQLTPQELEVVEKLQKMGIELVVKEEIKQEEISKTKEQKEELAF